MLEFRNHIITMPEHSTVLQKLNQVQDALVKLKEAQAYLDLFNMVISFMSYSESKQPKIVQLDLLKDAYRSSAVELIEEMETCLDQARNSLK